MAPSEVVSSSGAHAAAAPPRREGPGAERGLHGGAPRWRARAARDAARSSFFGKARARGPGGPPRGGWRRLRGHGPGVGGPTPPLRALGRCASRWWRPPPTRTRIDARNASAEGARRSSVRKRRAPIEYDSCKRFWARRGRPCCAAIGAGAYHLERRRHVLPPTTLWLRVKHQRWRQKRRRKGARRRRQRHQHQHVHRSCLGDDSAAYRVRLRRHHGIISPKQSIRPRVGKSGAASEARAAAAVPEALQKSARAAGRGHALLLRARGAQVARSRLVGHRRRRPARGYPSWRRRALSSSSSGVVAAAARGGERLGGVARARHRRRGFAPGLVRVVGGFKNPASRRTATPRRRARRRRRSAAAGSAAAGKAAAGGGALRDRRSGIGGVAVAGGWRRAMRPSQPLGVSERSQPLPDEALWHPVCLRRARVGVPGAVDAPQRRRQGDHGRRPRVTSLLTVVSATSPMVEARSSGSPTAPST